MPRFLNHTLVSKEIIGLFENAKEGIVIVSPYIKLHPDIKMALEKKINDPKFTIEVMYGKNEKDISKSLSLDDLEFFKSFQNVFIYYQENLHAKYFANENKSIITSINLHEYSIKNNIEVGILLERNLSGFGADNSMDDEAVKYFSEIFQKSTPVFVKEVKKKKVFFGLFEKNDGTEIHLNNQDKMYQTSSYQKSTPQKMGYCIRTGAKIPFNPKKPFSSDAFESWNLYKNEDFKERYCHFSGESSNGETSFARPILAKNWNKAMER